MKPDYARVCSLLPSATEMIFAVGGGGSLVAVSHECDYPTQAAQVPKVTRSCIPSGLSSREIDAAVSANLQGDGTLYELDLRLLEELQPDLIVTQRLCDVCVVSFDHVQNAAAYLSSHPRIVNLEPHTLSDILANVLAVGEVLGRLPAAEELVASLQRRIDAVRDRTKNLASRPRVFCMEWVNPPYCGGHWMKELVEIAGGCDDLAAHGRPSTRIEWNRVLDFSPEVIVFTCCGFDLPRCRQEAAILMSFDGVASLPAVASGRVFATDGSAYFSRPGPRIVDSLEILAHLIHPEIFPAPSLDGAFCAAPVARELRRVH